FVIGGGERARDMAERDIGNGGVEHHHEGGDRDHAHDQPGIALARHRTLRRPMVLGLCLAAGHCQRTRTVGSTDMPGPRGQLAGTLSSAIFTGTRCTTLTKLPVAFSGGSTPKAWPAPRWIESTCAAILASGQASTRTATF